MTAEETTAKSPIFEVKVFRSGGFEIEASYALDQNIAPIFKVFVIYWVPLKQLGVDAKTQAGRMELAQFQMAGFHIFPVPGGTSDDDIAFKEELTYTLERVKTIEEAFAAARKEFPKQRDDDFRKKVQKRLGDVGPKLIAASPADVLKYGKG